MQIEKLVSRDIKLAEILVHVNSSKARQGLEFK